MAIAFDAVVTNDPGNQSSYSFSHTITGTDPILFVGVSIRSGSVTVSSITYNGISLSLAIAKTSTDPGNNIRSELWYLSAPATNSNTVAITLSGAARTGAAAISFTGASQSSPIDATASAQGTSTTPSVNVTTVANNCWVIDLISTLDNATQSSTPGAGQTERADFNWSSGFNGGTTIITHEGPKTPAGSVTMSETLGTAGDTWAQVAASFSPNVTLTFSVSDTITTTEAINSALAQQIKATDNITISESINTLLLPLITTSETITTTENRQLSLGITITVTDTVTVSENKNIDLPIQYSVSEAITVTESKSASVFFPITTSDSITVTDIPRYYDDTVFIADRPNLALANQISTSDNITLSESVSLATVTLSFQVFDVCLVTENVRFFDTLNITQQERILAVDSTRILYQADAANGDVVNAGALTSAAGLQSTSDDGRFIRLTSATNTQVGRLEFDQTEQLPFNIEANFEFWSGGGTGADAIWFYWGNTITTSGTEDEADGGYTFVWDEFNSNTLQIKYNGVDIVTPTNPGADIDSSTWHTAKAILNGTHVEIWMDGTKVAEGDDSTRTWSSSNRYYGFGARTGATTNEHRIRNLRIESYNTGQKVTLVHTLQASDSVTLTENTKFLLSSDISYDELDGNAENIVITDTPNIELAPVTPVLSVSDSVTVSENKNTGLLLAVSVSDTVALSESLALTLPGQMVILDNITVTENPRLDIPVNIIASENIAISENIAGVVIHQRIVSDSIAVSESMLLDIPINLTIADNITVSESIAASTGSLLTIIIVDNITVTDIPQYYDDTVFVAESSNIALTHQIRVSDSVTLTESLSVNEGITLSRSENITTSESVAALLTGFINVLDNITTSESTSVTRIVITEYAITVSDSITITENTVGNVSLSVITSDNIALAEAISVNVVFTISKSESITITENLTLSPTSFINTTDSITLSESSVLGDNILNISVSDSITITDIPQYYDDTVFVAESVQVSLEIPSTTVASENITVSESRIITLECQITISENITVSEAIDTLHNNTRRIVVADHVILVQKDSYLTDESGGILVDEAGSPVTAENAADVTLSKVEINNQINRSETITLSENTILSTSTSEDIVENITISENVNIALAHQVTTSDMVAVTESIQTAGTIQIIVLDTITTTDTPVIFTDLQYISTSDTITVTENTNIAHVLQVQTNSESITLSESVVMNPPHIPDPSPKLILVDGRLAYLIVDGRIPYYTFV